MLNVINKLTILIPIHCLLVFLLQRLQKLLSILLEIGYSSGKAMWQFRLPTFMLTAFFLFWGSKLKCLTLV